MKPHMYVLNKEWQATIVYPQEMKEGREKDYCTLSGTDFKTDKPVSKDFFNKPAEEVIEEEVIAEVTDIEKLQAQYLEVMGKEAPARYKNDEERLNAKINETLTPAK